jgi:FkbM family methyltransferase
MELVSNKEAEFTHWVADADLLRQPMVVLDVGVQGGENLRWRALGDHLIVHGFDPIEGVIEELRAVNRNPNVTYHCMAIGDVEGTFDFHFNKNDPYSSSMYLPGKSRFERREPSTESRPVLMRKLDSLLDDGTIRQADFIKIDVEGFEGKVLAGASRHLSGLCGIEVESNFGVSSVYPETHFAMMMATALANQLFLFDLEFNRVPTTAFQAALAQRGLDPIRDHVSVGKPATLNLLFGRDLIREADDPDCDMGCVSDPDPDCLIKQMALFELYGLNDISVDLAHRFAGVLGRRLDVDKAIHLLGDPYCRVPGGRSAVQAKRDFDAAHQKAIERRIEELLVQGEAERSASKQRIEELLVQGEAERSASKQQIEELFVQSEAERSASKQRIEELLVQGEAERSASKQQIEELFVQSEAERSASKQRIEELLVQGEAERSASKQRIEDLVMELNAFREAHATTVERLNTLFSAEREAFVLQTEELLKQNLVRRLKRKIQAIW